MKECEDLFTYLDPDYLSSLKPSQVWEGLKTILLSDKPSNFFYTLKELNLLNVLFPEIDALFGVPQNPTHHPEIDCGIHTLMAVDRAAALNANLSVRLAVLLHDLGKAITPSHLLPKHPGHEETGIPLVIEFCNRLQIPNSFKTLAITVCRNHLRCHRVLSMGPAAIMRTIERVHGIHKPNKFYDFVLACKADAQGRLGKEDIEYLPELFFKELMPKLLAVTGKPLVERGLKGDELIHLLRHDRIKVIATCEVEFKLNRVRLNQEATKLKYSK